MSGEKSRSQGGRRETTLIRLIIFLIILFNWPGKKKDKLYLVRIDQVVVVIVITVFHLLLSLSLFLLCFIIFLPHLDRSSIRQSDQQKIIGKLPLFVDALPLSEIYAGQ